MCINHRHKIKMKNITHHPEVTRPQNRASEKAITTKSCLHFTTSRTRAPLLSREKRTTSFSAMAFAHCSSRLLLSSTPPRPLLHRHRPISPLGFNNISFSLRCLRNRDSVLSSAFRRTLHRGIFVFVFQTLIFVDRIVCIVVFGSSL